MSTYTFTPATDPGTTPRKLPNGDLVYPDGTIVKAQQQGIKVVGAGNAGQGSGTGGNHLKWDAIKTIANRGKGGGDDPNAWDSGDIGLIGRMSGVTIEDLKNREMSLTQTRLEANNYNTLLQQAGVKNPDGTYRVVQFGDTEDSLNSLISDAKSTKLDADRFRTEQTAAQQAATINSTAVQDNNRAGTDNANNRNAEVNLQGQQQDAKFDFEIAKIGLENDAKMESHKLEMEKWEKGQRRDNITALIAGLATLGAGFAM